MSQVYSTEPQTTGRVIINTTSGPIDINLWCKECPTITRTFLQLCLDGYYNGMIFHRIINNFLIQSGESRNEKSIVVKEEDNEKYMTMYGFNNTNGSKNEEAIAGSDEFMTRKRLELSPRIRFNHRGQVAMALPLDDEDIGEGFDASSLTRQFFITLDEAPFLQNKYVIFGTVSGDTIFNALRIGRTETVDEESGNLVDVENAPTIKSVRIESHLFDDLVMTNEDKVPWKISQNNESNGKESEMKKRRKKRKGKKDLNVLSFGAEMEDGDDGELGSGIVSSYDMKNVSFPKNSVEKEREIEKAAKKKKSKKKAKDEAESSHIIEDKKVEEDKKLKEDSDRTTAQKVNNESNKVKQKSENKEVSISIQKSNLIEKDEISPSKHERKKPKISAVEARRLKYLGLKSNASKKGSKQRDDNTMSKLSEFRSKMLEVKGVKVKAKKEKSRKKHHKRDSEDPRRISSSAPAVYSGQILESDDFDANDTSWLKGSFKCKRHIDHDSKASAINGGDGRNIDDYEVIDEKHKDRKKNDSKRRKR